MQRRLHALLELFGSASIGVLIGILLVGTNGEPSSGAARRSPAAAEKPVDKDVSTSRMSEPENGLILNFVKPDKTRDFEAVIAKVKGALQDSEQPEQVQQAANWNVYRAAEPGVNGSVLYVSEGDPAVLVSDEIISTVLAEAFPEEAAALYQRYVDAHAIKQSFVNFTMVPPH